MKGSKVHSCMGTAFSSLQIFSFPSKLEGLKIHPLVISRKDAKAAPQLGRAELSMFPLHHVPACVLGEGKNPSQTPPSSCLQVCHGLCPRGGDRGPWGSSGCWQTSGVPAPQESPEDWGALTKSGPWCSAALEVSLSHLLSAVQNIIAKMRSNSILILPFPRIQQEIGGKIGWWTQEIWLKPWPDHSAA